MKQQKNIDELKQVSLEIRKDIVRILAEAGSGHLGGSLGLADIFASLYFKILNHKPSQPRWQERDRLVLSIGHVAPVLYTTLAHAGYFDKKELFTIRKLGSRLQGHPGREYGLPGIELSAGSLGHGLSVAVGMALAAKMDNAEWNVFSIHGDGELQEGSIWEAAMSASHHRLDNLIAIVDRNGVQIDGKTSHVMEIEPLEDKFRSFGWKVLTCDGHDHNAIIQTLVKAKEMKENPVVVLAGTKMGKGIPSIENDYSWHGKPPLKEEVNKFIKEMVESF